jgi:hypothetical protein
MAMIDRSRGEMPGFHFQRGMMMRLRVFFLVAVLALEVPWAAVPAMADQYTIAFGAVPGGIHCGESWQEEVFALNFAFMTEEDYHVGDNYYCYFAVNPGSLELDGVRLYVNMWALAGVTTVEVDVQENWAAGATRAFLYTDGLSTLVDSMFSGDPSAQTQTLTVTADGAGYYILAVSGYDAELDEIRVSGASLDPQRATTWGGVKALY